MNKIYKLEYFNKDSGRWEAMRSNRYPGGFFLDAQLARRSAGQSIYRDVTDLRILEIKFNPNDVDMTLRDCKIVCVRMNNSLNLFL
ncbi:hypothetical protein [Lactobacillus crispatus]|uniref:hypothetical protein n=2 Tax=Lactobacillus crispatus TaxID=47770 RepID=UPI0039748D61